MGTSSSYKGSTSKVSRDLRDGLDQWSKDHDKDPSTVLPDSVIAPALRIPSFPRGSGSGGGGGGGGASGGGGSSRSGQSSPRRSARAYAATASRAARIAGALRNGDREALEKEGLDYDKLAAMPSRAEMVRALLEVVCAAQTSSEIPNEEQREIAGRLMDWMLDTDQNPEIPDTASVAEHSIGLIVAEVFLSEAGEFASREGLSHDEFVDTVYDVSQRVAAKAELHKRAPSQKDVEKAIETGLRYLRRLYPKENG